PAPRVAQPVTVSVPTIPSVSWPSTEHRYAYEPGPMVAVIVVDCPPLMRSPRATFGITKSWITWPLFVWRKVTVPHGTEAGLRVKPKSCSSTVTVVETGLVQGFAVGEGFVVVVLPVDTGEVVVPLAFWAGAGTPTPRRPFIPLLACPGTVQRNSYVPWN